MSEMKKIISYTKAIWITIYTTALFIIRVDGETIIEN